MAVPEEQVNVAVVFSNTTIDFNSPITTKQHGRSDNNYNTGYKFIIIPFPNTVCAIIMETNILRAAIIAIAEISQEHRFQYYITPLKTIVITSYKTGC